MNNGFLAGFISFSENLVDNDLIMVRRCPVCGRIIDRETPACPCMWEMPMYGVWDPFCS